MGKCNVFDNSFKPRYGSTSIESVDAGRKGVLVDMFKALFKCLLFPLYLLGIMLISLFVPCGGLFVPALAPAYGAGAEDLGHVSRIQGTVIAQQGQETRPLALHSPVKLLDILKTGQGARLELTMLDETKLTLGADTVFNVERYDLGRQPGAGAVFMRLTKGAFRVVTGELSALRGGPFEVSTPLAVIGIRGTDFWGGYITAEEVSVMLISGKGVYVINDAGRTEILMPGEGVALRSRNVPPPAPNLWSPELRTQAYRMVDFD